MEYKKVVASMLLVIVGAGYVASQVRPTALRSTGTSGFPRPKTVHLPDTKQDKYEHLFSMIAHAEQEADLATRKGDAARSQSLRKHFQRDIGLNDMVTAELKQNATAAITDIKLQDAKARQVIADIRRQTPGGRVKPGDRPPAVPRKLLDMQAERDSMINSRVDRLKQRIGSDEFQKIDSYATAEFSRAIADGGSQKRNERHFVSKKQGVALEGTPQ